MNPFLRIMLAAAIVAGAAVAPAMAQEAAEESELETDRDSFTPAATTVGQRFAVLEASYSFIDNRRLPDAHSFPELLVRYGISEQLELRLGWNYEAGGPTGAVSGSSFGGEDFETEQASKALYGAKYETSQQDGWLPMSSLIVQGYTPTSGPEDTSHLTIGEVFGWTFANDWMWNSAIRFGTNELEGDHFTQWAPSTVLKIPVGEIWNVHAEYFSVMSDGKDVPQNLQYGSFGGHVLVTPNIELGIRCGFGLNDDTPKFFNNVGLGWRF